MGGGLQDQRLKVVENTEQVHNVIVCTLCSCYPIALLGPSPTWYKSGELPRPVVREPAEVLAELGFALDPEVEITVWDATAESRYMVLPRRPPGTRRPRRGRPRHAARHPQWPDRRRPGLRPAAPVGRATATIAVRRGSDPRVTLAAMFSRMRRGWGLTKKAWGVIRSHPGLAKLPLIGGAFAFIVFVVFGIPGALLLGADSTGGTVGGVVLLAIGAYLASFAVIYFNVALAAGADQALRGEEPDIDAAKGVARSRVGTIAAWALVSAAVSVVLGTLRDRGGAAGNIAASIGGAIWSLVTFLVVPVLAFEGIGPFAAMKRSAGLFRQRWGQQVTGNVIIGGVSGLIVLVGVVLGVGGVCLLVAGSMPMRPGGGARRGGGDHRDRRCRVRRGHAGRVRRRPVPLRRRGPCARAVHRPGSRRRSPHPLSPPGSNEAPSPAGARRGVRAPAQPIASACAASV